MITLSISPDGDITISQETPGERIYMGEHYARMEREEKEFVSQESLDLVRESLNDDERAAMFKQGWESAIRESQLQYVNGRIEEFWNEMGVQTGEDPHHNEPEGTGEAPGWGSAQDAWDGLAGQPVIRPAVDSGEPGLEAEEVGPQPGIWTISNEELQSRLDAEFERGLNYSSPTVPPRYSAEQIAELRNEGYAQGYGQGIADSGEPKQEPRTIKFSALRVIADRVASQQRSDGEHASVDDLLREVASELGYEVTR